VSHKNSILIVMAALGMIVLGGIASVKLSASEPVSYSPNHHPRSVSVSLSGSLSAGVSYSPNHHPRSVNG
jgi:hypothetical protein